MRSASGWLLAILVVAGCGSKRAAQPDSGGADADESGSDTEPCSDPVASDPDVQPMLPQTIDTSYPATPGTIIHVLANGDLQAALDAAQPGDTIAIDPGATLTGPFTLPVKSGSGWVVVGSADAQLPPPGTRVGPADAVHMPKILAPNAGSAIVAARGAHHFRLVGLEIAPVDATSVIYTLVSLGDGTITQLSDVPHDIVLDRVYVHGTPTGSTKRGIELDAANAAVVDSYPLGSRRRSIRAEAATPIRRLRRTSGSSTTPAATTGSPPRASSRAKPATAATPVPTSIASPPPPRASRRSR